MKNVFKKIVSMWGNFLKLIKETFSKIEKWILSLLSWIKKWIAQIINLLVIIVAYMSIDEHIHPWSALIVGLWLFVLLSYYIFWKIFKFGDNSKY